MKLHKKVNIFKNYWPTIEFKNIGYPLQKNERLEVFLQSLIPQIYINRSFSQHWEGL